MFHFDKERLSDSYNVLQTTIYCLWYLTDSYMSAACIDQRGHYKWVIFTITFPSDLRHACLQVSGIRLSHITINLLCPSHSGSIQTCFKWGQVLQNVTQDKQTGACQRALFKLLIAKEQTEIWTEALLNMCVWGGVIKMELQSMLIALANSCQNLIIWLPLHVCVHSRQFQQDTPALSQSPIVLGCYHGDRQGYCDRWDWCVCISCVWV